MNTPALKFWPPTAAALPLVCDSPHSGSEYPADFGSCQPMAALRQAEDSHVEQLWCSAPAQGASLLAARFPRSYLDVNRALDDLDAGLLDGPWPEPLRPGERTRQGCGLIWRALGPGLPLYDRRLGVAEVQGRIERCWRPYRAALDTAVQAALHSHGEVWHLNLHSMPQQAGLAADVVLGDLDGRSCEPEFTALVERSLHAQGYRVVRNRPYTGGALVADTGRPAQRRHSLQIEVRRALYMDEASRAPNAGFLPLQRSIEALLADLAEHIRLRLR